jgi:phenylacetate-coenzyme A ligase PaaK-like adenylate-forming protein
MDKQTRTTFLSLIQSQTWTREAVVACQVQLLEGLCRHAFSQSPFWRQRLAPLFGPEGSFRIAAWQDVPVLTREEAWRNRDVLGTHEVPAVMAPLEPGSTTGSTGTPLPFLSTALSRVMSEAQLARAFTWRGLGVLNPIVISKAVTGDVAGRPAGAPLTAGDGPIHYVDFSLSPDLQVAHVRAVAPRLILTYPNVALTWVEAGYDFAGVHCLVLTGETCPDHLRARLAAVFAGPIVNLYSASESGPIAIETPDGGFNVCEENVFLESPPPDVAPGTPWPVVMTPLYAYGTPLIRYAPGDHAVFGARPHDRTPGLRTLERLAGRVRNMFRRSDGSGFWPNLSGATMMAIAPHTHRQLIQESLDSYVLKVVFDEVPSSEQLSALAAHVADVVGGGRVTVEAVDCIEDRRASGKAYEYFVCRIP